MSSCDMAEVSGVLLGGAVMGCMEDEQASGVKKDLAV